MQEAKLKFTKPAKGCSSFVLTTRPAKRGLFCMRGCASRSVPNLTSRHVTCRTARRSHSNCFAVCAEQCRPIGSHVEDSGFRPSHDTHLQAPFISMGIQKTVCWTQDAPSLLIRNAEMSTKKELASLTQGASTPAAIGFIVFWYTIVFQHAACRSCVHRRAAQSACQEGTSTGGGERRSCGDKREDHDLPQHSSGCPGQKTSHMHINCCKPRTSLVSGLNNLNLWVCSRIIHRTYTRKPATVLSRQGGRG